jgi:hypothetical protein
VASNDWLEHTVPALGTLNVPRAKGTSFQVTELAKALVRDAEEKARAL